MDSVDDARWRKSLARRLNDLGRWFAGRLVLTPGPADEVIPAERFADPEFLRTAIEDTAGDARILASRFTRLYTSVVAGPALIALAQGAGLDVSPARCRIVRRGGVITGVLLDIADSDVVRCARRPAAWSTGGPMVDTVDELRRYVWTTLYAVHLAPLYKRIAETVHVAPKLLWSNAAEWPGMLLDAALEYLEPDAARPFVADCQALLFNDRLPGIAGPNPLRGLLRWEPFDADDEFPHEVLTRRMCCLVYQLDDRFRQRGRLCQNCPHLPIDVRVKLIRERHGLSQSDPRGPAEQHAVAYGLARLAHD